MADTTVQTQRKVAEDNQFWQDCKQGAARFAIPAWMLAEERYQHGPLDKRSGPE